MQSTERSEQEIFEETREKDNIMQTLGPEVGHLYMRPLTKIWGTRPLRPSCVIT